MQVQEIFIDIFLVKSMSEQYCFCEYLTVFFVQNSENGID